LGEYTLSRADVMDGTEFPDAGMFSGFPADER
jgi:hypothetical protein